MRSALVSFCYAGKRPGKGAELRSCAGRLNEVPAVHFISSQHGKMKSVEPQRSQPAVRPRHMKVYSQGLGFHFLRGNILFRKSEIIHQSPVLARLRGIFFSLYQWYEHEPNASIQTKGSWFPYGRHLANWLRVTAGNDELPKWWESLADWKSDGNETFDKQ